VEREPQSKYKVGDTVRILDSPYMECPFTWVEEMTDFCGQEARIVDVSWIEHLGAYGYLIDIDELCCTWCENCFVMEPDLQESEFNPSILFQ
jgi:hypothetical protein